MDPLSIATVSSDLVQLCTKTTGSLNKLASKTSNSEPSIKELAVELEFLSQILNSIRHNFNDRSLAAAILDSQTGNQEHWQNVQRSMEDCKWTLKSWEGRLDNVVRASERLFPRKSILIKLTSGEVVSMKEQIETYREAMQLSLHLMAAQILAFSFHSHVHSTSVLSGDKSSLKCLVDSLKTDIQRLSLQFQRRKLESLDESKIHFIHLEDCIRSAEKFVSVTSDIVKSQCTIVGVSGFGGANYEPRWKRIEKRVPESSNDVDTATTASIQLPPLYSLNAETTLTSITKGAAEVSLDDPDPDIETLFIQHWINSAKSAIDSGKYAQAENYLKKILERSEAMYGEQFNSKGETLEMLATVYIMQKKWNEAEKICLDLLNQKMPDALSDSQRFKIMHDLAVLNLGKKDYTNAAKWCQQAIRGIKATAGMKNAAFYSSVDLFSQIYEAKGDYIEAEAYRTLLPPDYEVPLPPMYADSIECQEIEKLCRMAPEEAARQVGTKLLLSVTPHNINNGVVDQWEHIRQSIRNNGKGIVGSSLILSIANTGLELPMGLLLDKGADIETCSEDYRYTSLAIAVIKGHEAVVRFLLAKGSNVDASDSNGNTALIYATAGGREAIVRLLVENGANVNIQNSDGDVAIEYAGRFPAIQNFLAAAAKNQSYR